MRLLLEKSDILGACVSTLCVIHCIVTPFIFLAGACTLHECGTSPVWWKSLDYIFVVISFIAVTRSTKTTSKHYMKLLLWYSWSALFLLILNEKFDLVALPETLTHIAALSLAVLHIYNLKFCQCKTDKCCIHNE